MAPSSRQGSSKKSPVILAFDFETATNARNSACQLAVVRIEGWKVASEDSWLIRPPSDQFLFTHIHGIEWSHVRHAPNFGELWKHISPFFDGVDFLAAHNAPFDRSVLDACCSTHGLKNPTVKYIDSIQVARNTFDIFPTKLNNVCDRLGIPLKHHDAGSDARACAQILIQANAVGWHP